MAYTTEELQAIVDSYLLTKVEVPRFDSQVRNTLAIRDAVYDLLTAALFLKPDSLFYVVWLAKNRVVGRLDAEIALIDAILVAAQGLDDRPVYKVESVTDLTRAEAALLELNGVLNSSTGLKSAAVPAVQKFRSSVESFARSELQKNVVDGGDVVETPDELRALIYTKWQQARELRAENRDSVSAVTNALVSFEGVRLQTRILERIVAKMRTRLADIKTVMQGSAAIEQSRETFLELLAQRTLLTKAAAFRPPQRVVYSGALTLIDSEGTPPTISGASFSAPFMHRADAGFSVMTEDLVEHEVTFPRDTRAVLVSADLSVMPPLTGTTIALNRDSVWFGSYTFLADPPDGAALALVLQTNLGLSVDEVTWDGTYLRIYGGDGLDSRAELVYSTLTDDFVAAVFPGSALIADCDPTDVEDIRLRVAESDAAPYAEVFDDGQGFLLRAEGIATFGILIAYKYAAALNLVSPADGTWTTAVDLVAYGVVPGDKVTDGVETLTVLAVTGNTLVTTPTVLAPGSNSVYIGPDMTGVPVGAAVRILQPTPFGGHYRVTAVSLGIVLGLDRPTPTSGFTEFVVSDHRVAFRGRTTAVSSTLEVLDATAPPPDPGLTALGHTPSGAVGAEVTRASSQDDLLLAGVRAGDTVTLDGEVRTVTAVSPYALSFTPGVEVGAAPSVDMVERTAHIDFDTMVAAVAAAGDEADASALDLLVARLVRGARFTAQADAALTAHRAYLAAQRAALAAFSVAGEKGIDFVVRTMEEQGMDRALDLLLGLDFTTLFALEADAVSYSTHFVRRMAEAARVVTPVSKSARGPNGLQENVALVSKARGYDPWAGS